MDVVRRFPWPREIALHLFVIRPQMSDLTSEFRVIITVPELHPLLGLRKSGRRLALVSLALLAEFYVVSLRQV